MRSITGPLSFFFRRASSHNEVIHCVRISSRMLGSEYNTPHSFFLPSLSFVESHAMFEKTRAFNGRVGLGEREKNKWRF